MDNLTRHIEYLQSLISELNPNLANYGKNKAIRSNESSKISDAANQLERYLGHNKDLASLLLEYHNGNEYGYDETLQYQYVYKDTLRLITFLWIFRYIVRHDSATKYATHSGAKYASIPLERLPIISLQSTPLC